MQIDWFVQKLLLANHKTVVKILLVVSKKCLYPYDVQLLVIRRN